MFAAFREAVGRAEHVLDVPAGATVGEAVARLADQEARLAATVGNAMLAVNHEYVTADQVLHDDDELALIPPVSGG